MFNDTRLLVVDDEETICQGFQRILTPEGFRVETTNDARKGLCLATENDYAAILLDLRMPQMDGIEFMEELRKSKRHVPVIIITGYPSIASAASAMQLGAVDYITKPFTPRAVTRAVQRLLSRAQPTDRATDARSASPLVRSWIPTTTEFRYWDESWIQPVKGGLVRIGALLPRTENGAVETVWPPRVGWTVYQGLPLAGVTIANRTHLVVPAPISGEVVASNDLLLDRPSLLWDEPCGNGWIACIRPARLREEARKCKIRTVVLAGADNSMMSEHAARLNSLGCHVIRAAGLGDVGPTLEQNPACDVLMISTESFDEQGPELVRRINRARPAIRVIVIAPRHCKWESAYREQRIFYYAADPFGDNEIVDIIDAAFRPRTPRRTQVKRAETSPTELGSICVGRPDGATAALVCEAGLLRSDLGLGLHIIDRLADRANSLKLAPGSRDFAGAIQEAASLCQHVLVLLARDVGRLPGSLVREQCAPVPDRFAEKATTLVVQRSSSTEDPVGFDIRTTASLAMHIVKEMLSC